MSSLPCFQRVVAVLWPSFLMAGIATILFTTAFDPVEISIFADNEIGRLGAYSICFFLFWFFGILSSTATCYFLKPCDSFNKGMTQQGPDAE